MDDPAVDRRRLDHALRYIRAVNRRLGGVSSLIARLERWRHAWPADRPVTMLDIGTGSADLPIAAVRWARGKGVDLRVTAVDLHETTLELAREHLNDHPAEADAITLLRADALELDTRFEPDSFDYAHAGLFLHHLKEINAMTVLRIMDRLARRGIIWNDLVRSAAARVVIHAMTLGRDEMIRHDARVSVEAGFTKREVLDIAARCDLGYCTYEWSLWTHRFTLAGDRRG